MITARHLKFLAEHVKSEVLIVFMRVECSKLRNGYCRVVEIVLPSFLVAWSRGYVIIFYKCDCEDLIELHK